LPPARAVGFASTSSLASTRPAKERGCRLSFRPSQATSRPCFEQVSPRCNGTPLSARARDGAPSTREKRREDGEGGTEAPCPWTHASVPSGEHTSRQTLSRRRGRAMSRGEGRHARPDLLGACDAINRVGRTRSFVSAPLTTVGGSRGRSGTEQRCDGLV